MTEEVDRPYAGQEGEINDKLVLDLAWERQQKKVRVHGHHVRLRSMQIVVLVCRPSS